MKSFAVIASLGAASILCGGLPVAHADDIPESLLGFLEEGMTVRVHHPENGRREYEPFYKLTIYDAAAMQLASDTRKLSLDELRAKYPAIDRRAREALQDLKERLQEAASELPAGRRYGEPELTFSRGPKSSQFFKVTSIGKDYVLVTSVVDSNRKRVLAKQMIMEIYWSNGESPVYANAKVLRDGEKGNVR